MKNARSILAAVALVALAACSSHKTTVMTGDGAATVQQSDDGKSTTVTTKDGTVTVGQSADPSKLGAPIYPGATAAGAYSGSSDKDSGSLANFTTTDSFDKVYDYYKSRLPSGAQKMKMDSGDSSMAVFQVGEDSAPEHTTVTITGSKGTTEIQIAHGIKKAQGN